MRSSSRSAGSTVLLLALLVSCGTDRLSGDAATVPARLSSSEIGEVLTGNSLIGVPLQDGDADWTVFYDSDGVEYGNYAGDFDQGRWHARSDMLCSNWDNWGEGERCFMLYRNDAAEILGYSDGKHEWTAVVVVGDEHKLRSHAD